MADFGALLRRLTEHEVACFLAGDSAAALHGLAVEPPALQVVFARNEENRTRIVAALAAEQPYLRDVPPGMTFSWEPQTLFDALELPLTTALGDLDLMGQYAGGVPFEAWIPYTLPVTAWGVDCRALKLEALIELEENAAGGDPERAKALRALRPEA